MSTRSSQEEGGNASTTSCFVVRETVPRWDVARYRRLYPNTLDARRLGAMFSNERISRLLDCLEICRDTNTGAWNQRSASVWKWCVGTVAPDSCFNVLFFRHAVDVTYVRVLSWILSRTGDDWGVMRRSELIGWSKLYSRSYLVKDAGDWSRELDFEWRHETNSKGC